MKKILIALFFIAAIVVSENSFAQTGFHRVVSPDGIYVIAVGDNGLIFRSSNSGSSFAQLNTGTDDYNDICYVGNSVWICGEAGKIFTTTKEAFSITPYNTGTSNTLNGITFINDNTGFTCGNGGVLYKTINGGVNWTSSSSGLPGVNLNSVSFKDANNGVVVGNNGNIYITTNGGSTWSSASAGTTRNLLDVEYFSDGYVVSGEYGTLFIRPTGSGYTTVNTRTRSDIRGITGTSISNVRIAGGGGFIRNNIGSTEFLNFEANPMMSNLVDIHYFDANKGYAVSSLTKAILVTNNGGTTWSFAGGVTPTYSWTNEGSSLGSMLGMNICRHPYDNNTYFIASGNKVYVSRDKGESWTQISTISAGNQPHSFFVSAQDTNVWLVATDATPDKVMRTSNYGSTWQEIISDEFSNYGQPLEMDPKTPGVFYFAPDDGGVWKSTNNGASFTQISSHPFRSPCDLICGWDSPNTVFVADGVTGSGQGEIWKSVNGGVNWTKVWTNTSSSEIPALANTQFNPNLMMATNWSGTSIYKSTNGGDNWAFSHSTSHSGWGANFCEEDPNVYMSGSWSSGYSTWTLNGGTSWSSLSSGLSGSGGFMLLPEKGLILGQAGSSVYKFRVSYDVITSVEEITLNTGIPSDFDLSQNYPNPFNPSTKIRYDIPVKSNVKLVVYDQLGRVVNEIVNGVKNAGSYEVEFNGSELASGIYFYKLDVDGKSFTKKMILVK